MLIHYTSLRITMTQDDPLQWRQLRRTPCRGDRSYGIRLQVISKTGQKFNNRAI